MIDITKQLTAKEKLIEYYENWLNPCMYKPESEIELLWYDEKCRLGVILLKFIDNFDDIFTIMQISAEEYNNKIKNNDDNNDIPISTFNDSEF